MAEKVIYALTQSKAARVKPSDEPSSVAADDASSDL
jgi:hypothetical protein